VTCSVAYQVQMRASRARRAMKTWCKEDVGALDEGYYKDTKTNHPSATRHLLSTYEVFVSTFLGIIQSRSLDTGV